jgi:hypothetical protein
VSALDSERTLLNISAILTSPVCPIHTANQPNNSLTFQNHFQRFRGAIWFRQYYLEGGWGYIVVLCGIISILMNSGLQMSVGLISEDISERFKIGVNIFDVPLAGKWSCYIIPFQFDENYTNG